MDKPNWFSIKDAAEYLDVGEPTIYRWMREGRITFRKVGDSTRFFQTDLDAMIRIHPSEKDAEIVKEFCPVCHHDDLVEGRLQSTGLVYFRPNHKETKFWTLQAADVHTHARMCTQCGAITFYGDTAKLKALRVDKKGDGAQSTGEEETP